MSRGPGRLQRAILLVLEYDNPEGIHDRRQFPRKEDMVTTDEWTTEDVCAALSGGLSRYDTIRHQLWYELSEKGWWWDDTFSRQVRRALDRLAAVGRVEKRLVTNRQYATSRHSFGNDPESEQRYQDYLKEYRQPTIAYWRLADGYEKPWWDEPRRKTGVLLNP